MVGVVEDDVGPGPQGGLDDEPVLEAVPGGEGEQPVVVAAGGAYAGLAPVDDGVEAVEVSGQLGVHRDLGGVLADEDRVLAGVFQRARAGTAASVDFPAPSIPATVISFPAVAVRHGHGIPLRR